MDHPLDEESEKELSVVKKFRSAAKDLLSGLRPVLEVTKEVSDALPPLKMAVSGVLALWKVYDVREMCLCCAKICSDVLCGRNTLQTRKRGKN